MAINQKRILIFIVVILLVFLLLTQLVLAKELFKKSKLLQSQIKKQSEQNIILANKYQQQRTDKSLKTNLKRAGDQENTAEILEKLSAFKLRLIDFSSSRNELNLNLTGEFHSILQFIKYLEAKMITLKIVEFKIKSSGNNLFLVLKLENGMI